MISWSLLSALAARSLGAPSLAAVIATAADLVAAGDSRTEIITVACLYPDTSPAEIAQALQDLSNAITHRAHPAPLLHDLGDAP
ncbi:hypothetical protein M2272_001484 [Mycobacterium frederiksbergense]|uniref:Uncharacterized protein n=1 Tax=Mycolicibacterium frederiksbergense TaxID=117567 RepID=A0ABT6KYE6_9MYCO|nr:hypothetical protein [Mycolicibacterium frederiksbergense]MDH6194855.1 hypothetical protein [Mycolicibacterium frederiksbergense]